jgi:hypothetical protein
LAIEVNGSPESISLFYKTAYTGILFPNPGDNFLCPSIKRIPISEIKGGWGKASNAHRRKRVFWRGIILFCCDSMRYLIFMLNMLFWEMVDAEGEISNSLFHVFSEWEEQLKPLQSELLSEDEGGGE